MNRYNEAIQLIQQQQFLKAETLLKSLLQQGQTADEIKWALGLTQIYLGKPQEALSYWSRIQSPENYQLEAKKELVEHSLDAYQKLYASYNEALTFIQQKQYEKAWPILQQAIQFADAKPLAIYEAYVNVAYVLGKAQEVEQLFKAAPKHVLTAPSIHRARVTQAQMEQQKAQQVQIAALTETNEKTKRARNWFGAGTGVLAAALLAAVLVLQPKEEVPTLQATGPTTEEQATQVEKQPVQGAEELTKLNATIEKLEAQVHQLTTDISSYEQQEQLLASANMSLDATVKQAQLKQYQLGYYYYQNGQFAQAVEALENSRTVQSDDYFADDALYYLIRSKAQLGEDVTPYYEQFTTSADASLTQSPYYDDVLLQYAEYAIEQQNTEQAQVLLQQLITQFSNEWTGQRAAALLQQLTEA